MNGVSPTSYDVMAYPGAVYPQTQPDTLATVAALHGLKPASVARCRVLELGCGDGSNLVALAYALPGSEFVGLDLSASAIQRGNVQVEKLGLRNLRLQAADVLEAGRELGVFDFIIAHGLYSWVPEVVREKILSLCAGLLSEQGVAYVSYNAYPGNHLRDLARRMMHFHAGHFADPRQQIAQARALLKFVAEAKPEPGVYDQVVRQELDRVTRYTDAGFFHDDLSSINQSFYFHEFATSAARHGLQYLSEADVTDLQEDGLSASATAMLQQLGSKNVIAREQYLDFLKGRAFRQTLLCRDHLQLDREAHPGRVMDLDLFVAAEVRPVSPVANFRAPGLEDFAGPSHALIATGHPLVKAALAQLGEIWPGAISFRELVAAASAKLAEPGAAPRAPGAEEVAALAGFLLQSYAIGFAELHVHRPGLVTQISERPVASALARLQIQSGPAVSSLRHRVIKLEDAPLQHLLALLDGTRDRAALLLAMKDFLPAGGIILPATDLAGPLENSLRALALSGLLVS